MVYQTERQFKQQGQCLSKHFLRLFLQKKPSEVFFFKKGVPQNFVIFRRKHR